MTFNLPEAVTASVSGGSASGSLSLNGTITYDDENKAVTLAKDAAVSVNDLKVTEETTALNLAITALADSTLAIDVLSLVIKDGSSVNIDGNTFGFKGDLTLSGGNLSFGVFELLAGQVSNFTLAAGATLNANLQGISPFTVTAPAAAAADISIENGVISVSTQDSNGINISVGNLSNFNINIKGCIKCMIK